MPVSIATAAITMPTDPAMHAYQAPIAAGQAADEGRRRQATAAASGQLPAEAEQIRGASTRQWRCGSLAPPDLHEPTGSQLLLLRRSGRGRLVNVAFNCNQHGWLQLLTASPLLKYTGCSLILCA